MTLTAYLVQVVRQVLDPRDIDSNAFATDPHRHRQHHMGWRHSRPCLPERGPYPADQRCNHTSDMSGQSSDPLYRAIQFQICNC